jgi:hypothetical protein
VLTRTERIAPVMDLQLGQAMVGLSARIGTGPWSAEAGAELGALSLRMSAPGVPRSHRGLGARAGFAAALALTPRLRLGLRATRFRGRVALPKRHYFAVAGTSWGAFVEAHW